jgi:hypothetical protein
MGMGNSERANSRASLAAMPVSPEQFWVPRGNMSSSEKSVDEVRPISVDFHPVLSSVDGMAIDREASEARELDRLPERAGFRGAGPYRSVFTIEIKERTSTQLVSKEMAS